MKKARILAGTLIAAVMVMGAGYAAWSDTLNITTTATTGNTKVEFVDSRAQISIKGLGIAGYFINPYTIPWSSRSLENPGKHLVTTNLVKNTTNTDTAALTLTNLYPGSGGLYAMTFKNTGTIPVKITDVTVANYSDLLGRNLDAISGFVQLRPDSDGKYFIVTGGISPFIASATSYSDGTFLNNLKLNMLQSNLTNMLQGITMNPGDIISLDIPEEYKAKVQEVLAAEGIEGFDPNADNCMIFGLPKSITDPALETMTNNFSITINVKQFNK